MQNRAGIDIEKVFLAQRRKGAKKTLSNAAALCTFALLREKLLLLFLLLVPSCVEAADNRDGTYTNPIIDADYSDPDVIRVGDDFYLTASSFNAIPGLPILHSKDLVNWKIIGHALQRQPPEHVFEKPQHGNGVWAPSLRFHNNNFYIFYGDPDFGIYMVKAPPRRRTMVDATVDQTGEGMDRSVSLLG